MDKSSKIIADLEKQIDTLETELKETRESIAYKLGHIIKDLLYNPFNSFPAFLSKITSLTKEYVSRKSTNKSSNDGSHIRNTVEYVQPGNDPHLFKIFDDFKSYKSTKNATLRIGGILSSWLLSCLECDAIITEIDPDHWERQIDEGQFDLLIFQPTIPNITKWSVSNSSPDIDTSDLKRMIALCNKKSIVTVLWNTEDHFQEEVTSIFVSLFDYHYDIPGIESSKSVGPFSKSKRTLNPAIQPALHNPLKNDWEKHSGFTLLYDGWADILEAPDSFGFLECLLDDGLHIAESRYLINTNKLRDLPSFTNNVMGCITYQKLIKALRYYRVIIISKQSLSSSYQKARLAMEAISCGCSVVMSTDNESCFLKNMVYQCREDRDIPGIVREILSDEKSRLKNIQLARRTLYRHHTYSERLRRICNDARIEVSSEESPFVSIIVPTKRPQLIDSCLETFHLQEYQKKELIIVVNTPNCNKSELIKKINKLSNVHLLFVHQENNIGSCLNLGISFSKGSVWFKMDDDDYYGSHYVYDMMLMDKAADFHIFGKPMSYVHLEDDRQTYLLDSGLTGQFLIGSTHMPQIAGPTLAGKKQAGIMFSEKKRSCVDTDFQERAKSMGLILVTADIWNFINYRSSDKNHHTWRIDDKYLRNKTNTETKKLDANSVMI